MNAQQGRFEHHLGFEKFNMLPKGVTINSITQRLPFNKFKKPSWIKPPCIILGCGSFSPPTYLHLRSVEEARNCLEKEFEVIGCILSPVNDQYAELHKPSLKAAKGTQRVKMTELATKSSDWIGVSDFEVMLPQWTRTAVVIEAYSKAINHHYKTMEAADDLQPTSSLLVDKVQALISLIDRSNASLKQIHLKFFCGSDLLSSMRKPGLWIMDHIETILGKHGVVVIERDGHKLDEAFFNSFELFQKYRDNIHVFTPSVHNTISSSKVRQQIKKKHSIKYLTPDAVMKYIVSEKLYQ